MSHQLEDRPENIGYKKIRIVMDRPFGTFGEKEKQEFLEGLGLILGCTEDEMKDVTFRSGCVICEINLPEVVAEKLKELFKLKNNKEIESEELIELKRFIDEQLVSKITDDFEMGVNPIKKPSYSGQTILFVHGWSGGDESFGRMPEFLKSQFNCKVGIYTYPSGLAKHSPSVVFVSRNLENWINNYYADDELAIIAHSMGGIVTRKFIINQVWKEKRLDQNIRLVTFVASPHHGAVFSHLLNPFFNSQQISELSPNSPFLLDLNEHWLRWMARFIHKDCQVRNIVSTNDKIVSVNNAIGTDSNAVVILGADHTNIIKPTTANDEVVVTLARFLKDAKFGYSLAQA